MNRALTVLAGLLALLFSAIAICMVYPAWNKVGLMGAAVLFFPLHLLLVTLVAVLPWRLAARRGARGETVLFGYTTLLTLGMSLLPAFTNWRTARRLGVPLSIGEYTANFKGRNAGSPVKERTVVFGTASDGSKLELDVWGTGKGTSGALRPAILRVHGGGWVYGTRSSTPKWNLWLNELGYEVFDVEYRMPPPVRWLGGRKPRDARGLQRE